MTKAKMSITLPREEVQAAVVDAIRARIKPPKQCFVSLAPASIKLNADGSATAEFTFERISDPVL